ncbi:MAG: NTP/NDP exchange transporter [Rhabdochlamydiaceae bacterium]|jgi:AAA family ATP:ADP antiporter
MGIRKNFSYLAKSRYLILIAVLVVTFNIVMNLVEVVLERPSQSAVSESRRL